MPTVTSRDQVRFVPNLEPHEPTDNCWIWHCWSHDRDEFVVKPYRHCFECGHHYATGRDLRREYLAALQPSTVVVRLIAALTLTGRIWFCPICAHDW